MLLSFLSAYDKQNEEHNSYGCNALLPFAAMPYCRSEASHAISYNTSTQNKIKLGAISQT